MGNQHVPCRTPQSPIRLKGKVGSGEAPGFPGGGSGGWAVSSDGGNRGQMCGDLLAMLRDGGSKLGGAQWLWLELMA